MIDGDLKDAPALLCSLIYTIINMLLTCTYYELYYQEWKVKRKGSASGAVHQYSFCSIILFLLSAGPLVWAAIIVFQDN